MPRQLLLSDYHCVHCLFVCSKMCLLCVNVRRIWCVCHIRIIGPRKTTPQGRNLSSRKTQFRWTKLTWHTTWKQNNRTSKLLFTTTTIKIGRARTHPSNYFVPQCKIHFWVGDCMHTTHTKVNDSHFHSIFGNASTKTIVIVRLNVYKISI